ncbi:MAG: hypothetical protein JRN29_01895 [Nitrososphaerota archaeon]|nr:hypothetical protein [Nitrososphaerota archaeon]
MVDVVLFGMGNSGQAFVRALRQEGDGLWHPKVAGYGVKDVSVRAAFDVDPSKVGAKGLGTEVFPGLARDPSPRGLEKGRVSDEEEIRSRLRSLKPDVALNLISSGQDESSKAYARLCAEEGIAFANATSARIATGKGFVSLFSKKGVPFAGDDLMSQLGGTALHRGLVDFLDARGIRVARSYQLDVGGSPDTLNTISDDVRSLKRSIKSDSISHEVDYKVEAVAGTTDYVEFLGSRRTIYLWLEGSGAMDEPYEMDIFFKSSDPANAANVLLDVARALAGARRQGKAGPEDVISAFGFKNPPRPAKLRDALAGFEELYCRRARKRL